MPKNAWKEIFPKGMEMINSCRAAETVKTTMEENDLDNPTLVNG